MAVKATISPGYRWRLFLIAVALLAFGGWFLYDGAIGYPKKQVVRKAFEQIKVDHPEDWQTSWIQRAEAEGWPTEQPEPPFSDWDVMAQFFYAAPCLVVGAIFGFSYLRAGGRWVASDEQGLSANGGRQVAWADINSVDTSRWQRKGIAVVHYKTGGADKHITLDDWKFDRSATGQVFNDLKANTTGLIAKDKPPSAEKSDEQSQASA